MQEGDVHPDYPDVRRVAVGAKFDPHPCIGCPVPNGVGLSCDCGTGFVWYGESMRTINLILEGSKE
jgi:hypothetical protein